MRTSEVVAYPSGNYNWALQTLDEQIGYNPNSTVASITDAMGSSAQAAKWREV